MTAMLSTTALLLAGALAASDPDRLLALAPENALLVGSIPSLDAIRAQAATNDWWKLARDEELRPFVARVGEMFTESLQELGDDAETDDSEADAEEGAEASDEEEGSEEASAEERRLTDPAAWFRAVHGGVLAYLAFDGDLLGGMGVFAEPGPEAAAFDELWQAALTLARAEARESTQEYQGVELILLEPEAVQVGDTEEGEIALTIFLELEGVRGMVTGEERAFVLELAQGGIDRLLGKDPAPGFEGRAALAEARTGAPAGRQFELFADVAGFVRFAQAEEARARVAAGEDAEPIEEDLLMQQFLERLGLTTMRYAYAAGAIGAGERLDLGLSLHLPEGSVLQRASALARPVARELLALAPADASSASFGALDLSGLWHLVRGVVGELGPDMLAQFDGGVAAFEAATSLRLEQDLLQQFSGDLAVITVPIPVSEIPAELSAELDGEDVELFDDGSATALRVEDGSGLEEIVGRLLALSGLASMIEREEYQGHSVHALEMEGTGLHWCFTDEYMVVAQSPTPLRTVLARIGVEGLPSLLSDERYRALHEENARSVVLALSDARALAETLLQAGPFFLDQFAAAAEDAQDEETAADLVELLELLPDASLVARYIEGALFRAMDVHPTAVVMRIGGR
jgi:hypothetical protein